MTPPRAISFDDPVTPPPRPQGASARSLAYRLGFALGRWLAAVRWVWGGGV